MSSAEPTTAPVGHAPTAPTCSTLEATPETASALVPETATVPLTTPPGAWPETATVAVGLVVSTDTVTPDEHEGVQIQKPRAKPKPVVKQAPKPEQPTPKVPPPDQPSTPATSTKRTVLPYAPVTSGVSGQVAVDDANFEFAYYLQMVRAQIARNWTPPAGATSGARAEVYFRVSRSGSVSGLRIDVGSGDAVFDQSALRAVVITEQLPPLPLGYSGADLGIHFGFEYTGP